MRKLILLSAPLAFGLLGCPTTDQIDHMEHQPKGKPYRQSDVFPDHQLMRHPPADTVSLEHDDGNLVGEMPDGGLAPEGQNIPYTVDADFLALGQKKFDQVCFICHGTLGNGDSIVARKMSLRPPPNLTTDVYRARTDANIYMTITNGYGYMNPYRDQLSSKERWAVVSYVRALQLSANAPVAQLSPDDINKLNAPPPAKTEEGEEKRHE